MPDVSTHPTAQQLALFGHGKLPEAQATAVAAHLETCADCRQAVADLPPDSFFEKVRGAGTSATVPPSGAPAAESLRGAVSGPAAADVPPQLANHPKFRIVRELGRGGMGVIYLAEHRVMDKPVALKVISRSVLDNPDAVARFLSEVRAAGKLDHPNIARAHDADQAGDLHFLVMEYVEGMSLAQFLQKKGPLSVASACHCVCQAALGLQQAFEKGMAHRDIKPQNLMLTPRGQVKVLDFGLARLRGPQAVGKGLTQADAFMGTPEYVSPEQATDARQADIRADIYSLGCTLYALLTGRPPFVEDTMVKLVMAHIEKEPPPLHALRPDVPAEVSAVAAKMLAKDPAQRYQRPIEVAQALAPFAKGGAKARGTGAARPAEKSAGAGTVVGGDTSRVVGSDEKAPRLAANKPAGSEPAPSGDLEWTRHPPAPLPVRRLKKRREAPAPAPWWKRPAVLVGGGVGLALLLVVVLWAVGVFRVKTKDGTIVLENLPPDAEVLVDNDTATVTWGADGKKAEVRIKPGRHDVEVRKGGITVQGEKVVIEDGGRTVLTVRLESQTADSPADGPPATAPASKPDRPKADYDALATGRWTALLPSREEFERLRSQKSYMREEPRFDHGILEARGGGRLIFPIDAMNVIVRARVRKLSPKGAGGLRNVGLSLRRARGKVHYDAWFNGGGEFGIQKWDGSQSSPAKTLATCKLSEDYEGFFEFAFAAVGDRLTAYANGKRVLEAHGPEVREHGGGVMIGGEGLFQDVEVQVLDPAAQPASGGGTEFRPLFNGKDLTGWRVNGGGDIRVWGAENGVLYCKGGGGGWLMTDKEYSDFELRLEFKLPEKGNSGVALRSEMSGDPANEAGMEIQLLDDEWHKKFYKGLRPTQLTGSIYDVVAPSRDALKPIGEWNTIDIVANKRHVTVRLNGTDVVSANLDDHKDKLPRHRGLLLEKGHVGLQSHDGRVEFRKVEIKELK